jgi:hypothetical protein
VPNFILAFIPAQINRDTLNTMTAFAVRVCAPHAHAHTRADPGRRKRAHVTPLRLVDYYLMFFSISYHILFSESIKVRPYIS